MTGANGPIDVNECARRLQMLFWAMEENKSRLTETMVTVVREALRYSPGIDIRIAKRGGSVTLYPSGADELDAALVEDTLDWLRPRETVAKHFEEALRIALAKDTNKYHNLLDNLRVALEQLLKDVLGTRSRSKSRRKFCSRGSPRVEHTSRR